MVMLIDLSGYKDKTICVALSGGSDSIALTHYLYVNQGKYSYSLSAVNCEHGIRGKESVADSLFVRDFCLRYGIPLFFFQEDCPAKAKREHISLETAARLFRYECFSSLLKEGKADFIATAHHADDNAETILFRLCRGTSLSGLKGIAEREGFIRPFLNVTKGEILAYIERNHLSYVEDKTNADKDVTRNALRLNVLPELERIIPGAAKNIVNLSLTAREDDEFLYSLSEKLIAEKNGDFFISFAEKPLFTRATLLCLKRLGVTKDYTSEHLASVFALQTAENGSRICLPKNVEAIKEYDKICLYERKSRPNGEIPFSLGETEIGGRKIFVDKSGEGLKFDIKKLPAGCVFRFRKEGDFFKKFKGGRKKLKEYLNDKKIPLKDRDFIPLLAKGSEIFCVTGVEISDKIKTDGESDVYYIHMKKE